MRRCSPKWLVEADCPLVDTSPWTDRPAVATPDPRVVLAAILVRCDLPVALMEQAATTGWQATPITAQRVGTPRPHSVVTTDPWAAGEARS